VSTRRRSAFTLVLLLPTLVAAAEPAPNLEDKTREAEERIRRFDDETRRSDKRDYWEIPIVVVLGFTAGMLAERGAVWGAAAGGLGAVGLTVHFATNRKP
jgi:hypothetical protein